MNYKETIHTTIEKNAKIILLKHSKEKGMGDLISTLAKSLEGGKLEQVVIDTNIAIEQKFIIDNDPISMLQGGIFKSHKTLIAGDIGTGKFAILANIILELTLLKNIVLLVSLKPKDKIERAIGVIATNKRNKLPGNEKKIGLDLKILPSTSIFGLVKALDGFELPPILFIDHLEEVIEFDPNKFNKAEWKFFDKYLEQRKITTIASASVPKDIVVSNSVLNFDSIFYLVQTPVLLDGNSKTVRYMITIKSPLGTIHPKEYLLGPNWKITLLTKKQLTNNQQNTEMPALKEGDTK